MGREGMHGVRTATRTRLMDRPVALWAVGVLLGLCALVAPAGGALAAGSGPSKTKHVDIPFTTCGPPYHGEVCEPAKNVGSFVSYAPVTVTFTAGGNHCSGVALRLFVDGAKKRDLRATTPFTGPSGLTAVDVRWPEDGRSHTLWYEAEGTVGGCNAGVLGSWDGAIDVTYTPTPPTCSLGGASDRVAVASAACRGLAITMAVLPTRVELEADDAGKIAPKTIQVRVRLANTGRVGLTGVQLLSLRPVPADPTQQLDQLAFPRGALPVSFGKIGPGGSLVKTFSLRVTGDGEYVIKALALYGDPSRPGGNGRAVAQGGAFTVRAPLLYFKASVEPAVLRTVQGGESWYVSGHVKNLSSFQTLCLSPLNPKWEGNAGGLGPHQIGVVPVDEPAPPLAGTLAPGETISFLMRADTTFDGSNRSGVVLKPRASKGVPGDACNVLVTDKAPPLAASEIKVAKDSDAFSVHVQHLFPPGPGNAGALEFFGAYAQGSAKVLGKLYEGGLAIADEYGSAEKLIAALERIDPKAGLARAEEALSAMTHACAVTANLWINATPEERDAILSQISDDFVAKSHAVWDGVQSAVSESARGWFDSVVQAYYDGDTTTMFKALGGSAGEGLTESAIEMAKFEVGLALLKQTGRVFTVLKRTAAQSGVIARLKEVPVGRILRFEEMQRLWGLAQSDLVNFQRIAKEEGVLIGVRGRSPVSVKNLEEGAVWKHENLKPKNVNDIDTRFLGFAEADNGLVAFRTYTFEQKQAIYRKIATSGLDADQQAAAVARAKTRFGESQYLSKIEGFAKKGEIDVGFNYAENGLNIESTSVVRKFALEAKDLKGGGIYLRPLQENIALDHLASGTGKLPDWCKRLLAKVLCRVTGDMDGVYLTDLTGRALPEAKRLKVYLRLAAAGWQHPETLTWIKNSGEFFFSAKKKILAGLQLGGEAMMEFAPDGKVRATYLDLKKSVLTGKDNYFAAIIGGFTAFR